MEDLAAVGVGRSVAQKAVEVDHGVRRGVGLFGAEGAGGGEETGVDGTTIVQQVAYGYLQFFGLGGSGWRGSVESGGRLGGTGSVGGRCVYEGGGGVFDAKGAKAGEESGDQEG